MQYQQRQIFQRDSVGESQQHANPSFRCYLRRPNMQAQIQDIQINQSLSQLKEFIKVALKLTSDSQSLRLIVNQIQLNDSMSLSDHLHQNAIIHVLQNLTEQQKNNHEEFILKIKEPPMSCPIYELPSISIDQSIQNLKQKIHQFYVNEHNEEDLAKLQTKQIYLVYSGQILLNNKTLKDYHIDKNGIIYVVNGNKYVRQVTRQQAQKRIRQVRNKHVQIQPTIVHAQVSQSKEQEQSSKIEKQQNSQQNKQQDIIIVQNMVYEQDQQAPQQEMGRSGQYSPSTVSRSQKIIHRYDSLKNSLEGSNNPQQQKQKNEEIQKEQIHEGSELDDHRSGRTAALENYLSTENQQNIVITSLQNNQQVELEHEDVVDKDVITQYVQNVNQKVSQIQHLEKEPEQKENQQTPVFLNNQVNENQFSNQKMTQSTPVLISGDQNNEYNQPTITEDEDLLA